MKNLTLTLALVAWLPALPAQAANITATSRIDSVSLFRDGARVTRIAQIEAPAGKSTIRFEGLPSSVDFNALEASLGEAKGVVRNAKIFPPETPKDNDEVEALREKLADHRRKISATQREKSDAKARLNFVEDLAKSFAEGYGELADNGSSLSLEQGLSTWELVNKTRREAADVEDAVDETVRQLVKEEEDIKEALRKAQENDALTRSTAEVEIDLDFAQPLTLTLSYQALSARWQPHYELRAKPADAQLDFGYFAKVWQQTGEDWTDVSLSLHTNQARRQGNVPELSPMVLQEQRYAYQAQNETFELSPFVVDDGGKDKGYRAQSTLSGARMADAAPPPPSAQEISVSTSTVAFEVTLPGQVSVPSTREGSTLPVTTASFKAEYWSEAVPKLQLDAYLRARAVNELTLPILPGVALAFVDGKLSSKVSLPKTLPSEEIELSLGADPNIVIERIEGAQENKDTGFIGKTATLTRSYTNKVASYHRVAHKIVIVDQFPIAPDEKIEITRLSPLTQDIVVLEDQKDSGIFQWETRLQPKENREFTTQFRVVHPRDWYLGPQL